MFCLVAVWLRTRKKFYKLFAENTSLRTCPFTDKFGREFQEEYKQKDISNKIQAYM